MRFVFFKQKTAYEMRISDWSSDVCSSDLFTYARMVTSLDNKTDYKVDEKAKSVTLTDLGVKRIEQKIGVTNLYEESFDTIHHVESALKASKIGRASCRESVSQYV